MRKILLVEDEEILRDTYQIILSTQPYMLEIASDGQVALNFCKDNEYDLILIDLMMPIMSGVQFLEKFMPTKPEATHIIVLSNLSSGKDYERAIELGVDRMIVKADTTPKELLSAIRHEIEAPAAL